MIVASLHEINEKFGGDIKTAQTFQHWKKGDLLDHVKSALIYSDKAVGLVNKPAELESLATFLFDFYADYTVAQCNHTFLMKRHDKVIFVNFFITDVCEHRDFNPFLL